MTLLTETSLCIILHHHGAIINHSLDSEVIGSQFSIIDL